MLVIVGSSTALADDVAFEETVRPILEERCYTCHSQEMKKGGVDLEGAAQRDKELWWAVLKKCGRASCRRPASRSRLRKSGGSSRTGSSTAAFGIDPKDPDPGRVTVRRLNRVEYRNTIRDLIGVDLRHERRVPSGRLRSRVRQHRRCPDAVSLAAGKVPRGGEVDHRREVVPTVPRVVAETKHRGPAAFAGRTTTGGEWERPAVASYYEPATVSSTFKAEHAGRYRLILDLSANERYVDGVIDYNRCRLLFKADGEELLARNSAGRTASRSASSSIATGKPGRTS